ncbi:MAG: hypothetical protein KDK41_09730 [Leptospiraceae bacterium]|nr:hypothetical protein [Leptospiraceae bacterium]
MFALSLPVYSETEFPAGYDALPKEIRSILENKRDIITIQSKIRQWIRSPDGNETRAGYYWANSQGHFRIEYISPRETLVFDGRLIYWKIADNPFTWTISGPRPPVLPGTQDPGISDYTSIELKERTLGDYFSPLTRTLTLFGRENTRIEAELNLQTAAFTERKMFDHRGRLFLHEKMTNAVLIDNFYFYSTITVRAVNPASNVSVTNKTEYSEIQLNQPLPTYLFKPLPGPFKIFETGR